MIRNHYLSTVWEKLEDHQALINDQTIYPKLGEHIRASVSGPLDMFHVSFEPNLASVLDAPFTSVTQVKAFQAGKTGQDFVAALSEINEAEVVKGNHGAAYGKAIEKDTYVLLTGWDDPAVRGTYLSYLCIFVLTLFLSPRTMRMPKRVAMASASSLGWPVRSFLNLGPAM